MKIPMRFVSVGVAYAWLVALSIVGWTHLHKKLGATIWEPIQLGGALGGTTTVATILPLDGGYPATTAPGTPAYNPSWYTNANIYYDPANNAPGDSAADSNDCLTATTACLTPLEFIRRYGSDRPRMPFGQSINVHQLSAETLNSNPWSFEPYLSGGGHAALIGTLTIFNNSDGGGGTYTLGTVTLANQAGGTDLTVANMPAGTTAGMIVQDTAGAGSYAVVESMSGSTGTLSQPLTSASLTTIGLPSCTLAANWATGDGAVIYNVPPLSNVKVFRGHGGDVSDAGGNASVTWMQWVHVADSSGAGTSEWSLANDSASTILSGAYVEPRLHVDALNGRGNGIFVFGSYMANPVLQFGNAMQLCGDYLASTFATNAGSGNSSFASGNTTVHGASTILGGLGVAAGGAHFAGNVTVQGCTLQIAAPFWGAAGIFNNAGGVVWLSSGSWAVNLLNTGTNQLGTLTTGTKYTGSGGMTDGVAITQANLTDAGSLFNVNSGARFTLGQ